MMKFNEEPDNAFADRLRAQPLKGPPPPWREEILAAARKAVDEGATARTLRSGVGKDTDATKRIVRPWADCLWPHPAAWAGLAAAWVLILGIHALIANGSDDRTQANAGSIREVRMALMEQRRLREELLGPNSAWMGWWREDKERRSADPADRRPRSALIPEMARV